MLCVGSALAERRQCDQCQNRVEVTFTKLNNDEHTLGYGTGHSWTEGHNFTGENCQTKQTCVCGAEGGYGDCDLKEDSIVWANDGSSCTFTVSC